MEGKKNRPLLFAYFEVLSNSKLQENVAKENNECQKQYENYMYIMIRILYKHAFEKNTVKEYT